MNETDTWVNKQDFSIAIKITKEGKEKLFDLPLMCDNQVWAQIFKTSMDPSLSHTVEVPDLHIRIDPR